MSGKGHEEQTGGVLSAARLALAVRRLREERPDARLLNAEPIAVVGIGCRLPGDVHSPADFWRVVANGVDTITEVPPDRWASDDYYDRDPAATGKTNCRWGGFIADVDRFDPLLFGISPREAASMDPQQRLLLEVAWEAIEDSGRAPESLAGSRTGVFVGIALADYERVAMEDGGSIHANTCTGSYRSVASGRISFLFDFRGPSLSVDTACSSSLVAVHTACLSLRSQECDFALAGGVNLHLLPEHYIGLARMGMLATDGRCKTFDASADGFVPSEGCGLVALKRLGDAMAAGDRIYAVIRGSAVNQDGRSTSLTAPSGLAQQDVIVAALENARLPPSSISYVETHGTGTALGDPIEVEALAAALGDPRDGAPACVLGAAKTNFGHLEAAAGVTGLIRAALALHHQQIPANLHFRNLNPHIAIEGTRLSITAAGQPWPRAATPRFAGVSSFGFSGTNAHVVLEEAPKLPLRAGDPPAGERILLISARTPPALQAAAHCYSDFLAERGRAIPLYDICHAAAAQRSRHEERLAIAGATHAELRDGIEEFLAGRRRAGLAVGRAAPSTAPVVFACSGQGSQWPSMGMSLLATEPAFREAMEECAEWIHRCAGWSLIEELRAPDGRSKLDRTEYAQPAIFAIQVSLARQFVSWGVHPAAVIGHSAGEVAAAHLAGALTLPEAARIVVARGRVMEPGAGMGKMAAVRLPVTAVFEDLKTCAAPVSVAAINSPQSTVVSGDKDAIDTLLRNWQERGVHCAAMPANYAFHSAQMAPFAAELARELGTVAFTTPQIPLISTLLGKPLQEAALDAGYWARNVRATVQFSAAVQAACAQGMGTFLELGPHPVLTGPISEHAAGGGENALAIATLRRGQPEQRSVLSSLGQLHVVGSRVSWDALYPLPTPPIPLPGYPWQKQRYPLERRARACQPNAAHRFLGRRLASPQLRGVVFETELHTRALPFLADHRIEGRVLVPMAAWIEMAQQAVRQACREPKALADVTVVSPLELSDEESRVVQMVIEEDEFRILSQQGDQWVLNASGRIVNPQPLESPASPVAGISVSPDIHYARLARIGVVFGPAFRTVETIAAAEAEAWVRVRLQEAEKRDAGQYLTHPALLDGCLQGAIAALEGDLDRAFLPLSVEQCEIHRPAGDAVSAHIVLRPASNPDLLSADIEIFAEDGELIGRLQGLHMKRRTVTDSCLYSVEWRLAERANSAEARTGSWLILSDAPSRGAALATELQRRGLRAHSTDAFEPFPQSEKWTGIVRIGNPDAAGTLRLLQKLAACQWEQHPQLWLVTTGAIQVTPADRCDGLQQAPVWGLLRTAALEHPELACFRVDCDPAAPDDAALAEEIVRGDGEEETAFRAGLRYVRRLARAPEASLQPVRWTVPDRGSVEKLALAPVERRFPAEGEVEVEVEASALNFRDVLNLLGKYPGDAGDPGVEFCGRIVRIGPEVNDYRAGDRVMGVAFGAMASFLTVPVAQIVAAPSEWKAVQAAALPNAYLTAWHCLMHLGKLQRGERVLIHAATGGVGLAALHVARLAGAEIFATAGSDEKRAFLRALGIRHVFHSRTGDFAREISAITGGKGVDLVLNSLAGDLIAAGFEVLGEGGRFLEIGKNDLWTHAQAAALGRRIQYFIVDLAEEIHSHPALVRRELGEIRDLLQSGALPLLPVHEFDFADARSAFLLMAQARHIGKIALRHATSLHFRAHATYLITGGLGAIGLHAARWMAARGARHLLLVSRSPASAQAMEAIEALRHAGTHVEVRAADVSSRQQLDSLLSETDRDLPPLAGVFHAAGVVDDGVIAQQDSERFARVMAPKVAGAWNLHECTADRPLDFFILCSSVASALGSPAQSGYAAGNAFLDALAQYRRARGLPALSVNWGAWADGGMATQVAAQGRRRVLPGIHAMTPADCFRCLERAAVARRPQMLIADVDWTQFQPAPRLLASLSPALHQQPSAAPEDSLLDRLQQAPPGNRRRLLLDFLRDTTLRILALDPSSFLDERQPLTMVGLDSLMAIEFRNRLAGSIQRSLSATLLFDHPTLGDLASFLNELFASEDASREADTALEELEALSEAEAEELLKTELNRT